MAYYYSNEGMEAEKLQVHYYIMDGKHSMDAFVKNKSEAELLKIVKEVSDTLNLKAKFESEALKEGGVQDFISFVMSEEVRPFAIYFGGLLSGILTNVLSDVLTQDREMEKLTKEQTRLNIKKLKKELGETDEPEQKQIIVQNIMFSFLQLDNIKRFKSKFYSALLEDRRITKLSSNILNRMNQQLDEDQEVPRAEFKKFIIDKIPLDSIEVENAIVEIVSPVLTRKRLKWRGIHDKKPISFNMLDDLFQEDVIQGLYSFSNGNAIRCTLEFEREVDDEGNERITKVNAYDVLQVVNEGQIFETRTARRNRDSGDQTSMW